MIVYYFRADGVYLEQGEVAGPGWSSDSTPTSPLPIPTGSYAVWSAPEWSYVAGDPPSYPAPTQIQQENKNIAVQLLQETDWTCTVDINNPLYTNPYLTNQDAFLTYRSQVRAIAVNPPSVVAVFPQIPSAAWSS